MNSWGGQPIIHLLLIQPRGLRAPCQYFQLSMALTFPVAGVLISSANCWAPERSSLQAFTHAHSFHRDLKISRCYCKSIIQLISRPQGPSIFHKHKLPFITLAGISQARGTFRCYSGMLRLALRCKRRRERWAESFSFPLQTVSTILMIFFWSATAYDGIAHIWNDKCFESSEKEGISLVGKVPNKSKNK